MSLGKVSRRFSTVGAFIVALMMVAPTAYADHVTPVPVDGNPTCLDLLNDADAKEYKINSPTSGTFVDPVSGFSITITVHSTPAGPTFDFSDASWGLDAVFVKGGPSGNLYSYDPPVTADTGLHAQVNPSNGKYYGLSHISFCWIERPSTDLTITTVSPNTMIHSGDSVTLTITETNDGTIPLSNVTVTGDNGCTPAFQGGDDGDSILEPGETWTYTCTVTNITSDVTITVTGAGDTPQGETVTWCAPGTSPANTICDADERDQVTIDVINPSTSLSLDSADPGLQIGPNTSVTLTFAETNDGDVALTNANVSANNGCSPVKVGDDGNGDAVLDVGETWFFECTVSNIQNDVTITAIGSGVDPLGFTVTYCTTPPNNTTICDAEERTQVSIDVLHPSTELTLADASPGTSVQIGSDVTLTFAEKNDGDSDLTNVNVTADNGCNPVYDSGDDGDNILNQGETWYFTCTITNVQSDLTVTAIGTGEDPFGNVVTYCTTPPNGTTICDQDERTVVQITVLLEGCTPGYWRNHLDSWGPTGYSPGQTLESVFDVPDAYGLDNATLLEALSFDGGKGKVGAAKILLRAAVASLLNASHPDVNFTWTAGDIIDDVNTALTGSRGQMLSLATQLDDDNNALCPLN